MSAEILTVIKPDGGDGSVVDTTIGGRKPLHRFLKGQPKIIGIIVLILGSSFFVISVAFTAVHLYKTSLMALSHDLLMGTLFILSGILFILTEHNPTKKTVTISLAFSIVSLLFVCWTLLQILPYVGDYRTPYVYDENFTETKILWISYSEAMRESMDGVIIFYSFIGAVIMIVMSVLAGAALRSTKSQATVVMTKVLTETPPE